HLECDNLRKFFLFLKQQLAYGVQQLGALGKRSSAIFSKRVFCAAQSFLDFCIVERRKLFEIFACRWIDLGDWHYSEHKHFACAANGHSVRCLNISGVQLRWAHRLQVHVPICATSAGPLGSERDRANRKTIAQAAQVPRPESRLEEWSRDRSS